jgi:hypothetical protein
VRKEDQKMMMKQRGSLLAMIAALGLVGFVGGSAVSNAQVEDETKSGGKVADESAAALSMGAKPAAGPTNEFGSGQFNLGLRDWSGQVGLFAKTRDRANYVQTIKMADGTTFVGEIDNQRMDGWGIATQPTGTRQEGEWRRGEPYRVTGVYVTPDGAIEIGSWNHAGVYSGGSIDWKDGHTYKGEWKVVYGAADLPDGVGTMTWPDGRTYKGHFLEGRMDGSGRMSYPDGRIEQGIWMQGKFMAAGLTPGHALPTPERQAPSDYRILE